MCWFALPGSNVVQHKWRTWYKVTGIWFAHNQAHLSTVGHNARRWCRKHALSSIQDLKKAIHAKQRDDVQESKIAHLP